MTLQENIKLVEDSYREQTQWPGTPSLERVMNAWKLLINLDGIEKNEPAPFPEIQDTGDPWMGPDTGTLCQYPEINEFREWADTESIKIRRKGYRTDPTIMLQLAPLGATERFIGMATAPIVGARTYNPFKFTRIYRNPEWAGFDQIWPSCRGLDVHVFAGEDMDEPEGIIGIPASWDVLDTDNCQPAEPRGELVLRLREIALWHGAKSCLWYP